MAKAKFVERRVAQRFKLTLPVQWKDGAGVTRDISTSGLFFETETAQSIGDTIGLSVDFGHTAVQCEGRVVRVEKLDGKFGIAVEVAAFSFQ